MLSIKRKNKEITQSQLDYANELYLMFHKRNLKPDELTKENVEYIIRKYSLELHKAMQLLAESPKQV